MSVCWFCHTAAQWFVSLTQTLPKLEKEVLDWEQKYKSLTAIDDLRKKMAALKNELAWAWVIDKEKVGSRKKTQKKFTILKNQTKSFDSGTVLEGRYMGKWLGASTIQTNRFDLGVDIFSQNSGAQPNS